MTDWGEHLYSYLGVSFRYSRQTGERHIGDTWTVHSPSLDLGPSLIYVFSV